MEKIILTRFNLKSTLSCGQFFRFSEKDGVFTVFSGNKLLRAFQNEKGATFIFDGDFEYWHNFFDLRRDYEHIEQTLSKDAVLRRAISESGGIRILNQNKFECLISFIISQNNNIPRIKSIIERLCAAFGEALGGGGYAFPTADSLSAAGCEGLTACGTGFRARYIMDAAQKIVSGDIDLDKIESLPADEIRAELKRIAGVGPKVADCVLLYAFGRRESYPIDVWVKRLTERFYFDGRETPIPELKAFAAEKFGDLGGYAQQYLFNLSR